MSKAIKAVNDFVVKFANVNGSGSASANELFAKAVMRMGVPIATRNIFPSNIQGLPTWFEVRVNEKGYLGRREGVDVMVAMNAETAREDVMGLDPGRIVVYEETLKLNQLRRDLTFFEGFERYEHARGIDRAAVAAASEAEDIFHRRILPDQGHELLEQLPHRLK